MSTRSPTGWPRTTLAERDEAIRLLAAGGTLTEVATALNLSVGGLQKIIRRAGHTCTGLRGGTLDGRRRPMTSAERSLALRMICDGSSMSAAAAAIGSSVNALSQMLRHRGLSFAALGGKRGGWSKVTPPVVDEARRLTSGGLSISEAARRLVVPSTSLARALQRAKSGGAAQRPPAAPMPSMRNPSAGERACMCCRRPFQPPRRADFRLCETCRDEAGRSAII